VGLRVIGESTTNEIVIDGATDGFVPSALGGYPFGYSGGTYELSLDNGQYVRIYEWNDNMNVLVSGSSSDFSSATGMCGSW